MTIRPKMDIKDEFRQARQVQFHEDAGTYPGEGWFFYDNVSMVCDKLGHNKKRCEKRYPTARVKIVERAFGSKGNRLPAFVSIWFKFEEEDNNGNQKNDQQGEN